MEGIEKTAQELRDSIDLPEANQWIDRSIETIRDFHLKPDIECVDLTARMNTLNDILEVTTKPIIYDGDTGGIPEHFVYMVRTLERLGVSAVIIEDKIDDGLVNHLFQLTLTVH